MLKTISEFKANNQPFLGIELTLYCVRSILESLIKVYDAHNLRHYLEIVL